MKDQEFIDHYELLGVAPEADLDAVESAVRSKLAEFNPEHSATGDAQKYEQVKQAYLVLADPTRRQEFDTEREQRRSRLDPAVVQAEGHKRHAVLAALYKRRLHDTGDPSLSANEIAHAVGVKADDLRFCFWYLRDEGFVERTEQSAIQITIAGARWIEEQSGQPGPMDTAPLTRIGSGQVAATPVADISSHDLAEITQPGDPSLFIDSLLAVCAKAGITAAPKKAAGTSRAMSRLSEIHRPSGRGREAN